MSANYNDVPYLNLSYLYTHPDHLATLARLMGLQPAPVEHCRVLSLGCASGGNLIPMAYGLPESEFVGVDYSARQIEAGQTVSAHLGLDNITLHALDVREMPAAFGQFDYIIAHGLYSWVSAEVQDQVLEICRRHLAPQGIAYVSYNTLPGWSSFNVLRAMMHYRTRALDEPRDKVAQAQEMLAFLQHALRQDSAYQDFMRHSLEMLTAELQALGDDSDVYLFHDLLETHNQPVYFHQFMAHAAAHDLQYLCEARFRDVFPHEFPPEVLRSLQALAANVIDQEQYMDFLRNKTFRRTLLCHAGLEVDRNPAPARVRGCYVTSRAQCTAETPDVAGETVVQFHSPDGLTISFNHPLTKAAFLHLAEMWPRAVAFDALVQAAGARLGLAAAPERDVERLAAGLLQAFSYSHQLAALHGYHAPVVAEVRAFPQASPVARYQARHGEAVTNLWYRRVALDATQRRLLGLLDGAHDHVALRATSGAEDLAAQLQWMVAQALLIG